MKGHVAPENLNGGLNNQTSASIVFDRLPSYLSLWGMACCSTALLVVMVQVAQMWLLSLYSKVPRCILWPEPTWLRSPSPPPPPCAPFPHYRLGWMQECLVSPPARKCRERSQPYGVCTSVFVCGFIVRVLQQDSAWQPESVACPCVRMWKCVTGLVCESAVKCCPTAPPGCQLRFTMLN